MTQAAEVPVVQADSLCAWHLSARGFNETPEILGVDNLHLTLNKERRQLALCVHFFLQLGRQDRNPCRWPKVMASTRSIQAFLSSQKTCFLHKIDLPAGGHVEFDTERAKDGDCGPNRSREIFPISVKAGRGRVNWYHRLSRSIRGDLPEPKNTYYFSCDR